MPIENLSIVGNFDKQRFVQFNPCDTANWYLVPSLQGKKKLAMYPVMGRRHINFLGLNRLIFSDEPRGLFTSINYSYIVVANSIFRIDKFYNQVEITQGKVTTLSSDVFFDYLVTPDITFACFVDGEHIYIYREDTGSFDVVTDPNAPSKPKFIAAFANRIVVSQDESSQFSLSQINLGDVAFDPTTCFTIAGQAVFAQEEGIVRQFAVLHNTLYIMTDFTTGIWNNIPSVLSLPDGSSVTFPWKKNSTYDWDWGIFDPKTLDVCFGLMVWMGQSKKGLIQVLVSNGQAPTPLSSKAIDILFQRNVRQGIIGDLSPFLNGQAVGFLYQWENTIFYRLSAGPFHNYGILDIETDANSIEYNFDAEEWHRVIEKNGERSRIQRHTFYNNTHLVTVLDDSTVFEMSGQFYTNETTNILAEDPQSNDAYIQEPFRYERITPIICDLDYGEFITDYVEIDFVWGESNVIRSSAPFQNAQFLIDEEVTSDGSPQYLITEDSFSDGQPVFLLDEEGNTPSIGELTYNNIFKPHIELYWSDDGGISFYPADVLEFSQLGQYEWRMRWYQLGPSRNRCYKLVCVSSSPIVVLGGVMYRRRASDGAS